MNHEREAQRTIDIIKHSAIIYQATVMGNLGNPDLKPEEVPFMYLTRWKKLHAPISPKTPDSIDEEQYAISILEREQEEICGVDGINTRYLIGAQLGIQKVKDLHLDPTLIIQEIARSEGDRIMLSFDYGPIFNEYNSDLPLVDGKITALEWALGRKTSIENYLPQEVLEQTTVQ